MTQTLRAVEKETALGVKVEHQDETVSVTKGNAEIRVDSHVFTLHAAREMDAPEAFTRESFEGAIDKVSRPLKGRFAHLPYSSAQFIEEKRKEVELEDR